jgi:hypothetical protein
MKVRRGWVGVLLMAVTLVAFLAALVGFHLAGKM